MIGITLGLGEVPDGGLRPTRVPFVRTGFEPAVENRLMLPLVGGSPHDKAVLDPDAGATKVEARFSERPAEVFALGVGVEDICRATTLQVIRKAAKRREEEDVKLLRFHAVVLDLQSAR